MERNELTSYVLSLPGGKRGLAEAAQVRWATVHAWLEGRREITVKTAIKLAIATGSLNPERPLRPEEILGLCAKADDVCSQVETAGQA